MKNNNYPLASSSNPFAKGSYNPFASSSSKPKPGYTPCAIDTKLPKQRRQSLCYADPNCTWTGEFCKFQPRKLEGTSRLSRYGDYQGPRNLDPLYRNKNPGPSMSKIVAKERWKKATRAAKEDMRKRIKAERKQKQREKTLLKQRIKQKQREIQDTEDARKRYEHLQKEEERERRIGERLGGKVTYLRLSPPRRPPPRRALSRQPPPPPPSDYNPFF